MATIIARPPAMLSRRLTQYVIDHRSQLPPIFLLPWTASLSTASTTTSPTANTPPPPPSWQSSTTTRPSQNSNDDIESLRARSRFGDVAHSLSSPSATGTADSSPSQTAATSSDSHSSTGISSSIRELLPLLRAQSPHYITVHIHGFPYLVTEGDTLRLPYLMHGVEPGDVIRLNRAINLGSRDYTLKAPSPVPKVRSPTTSTTTVLDPTTGNLASTSRIMPQDGLGSQQSRPDVPHFIPHIAKGKHAYIDDRLFECRAVVMGTESEPMRIKEKTKRRQRHVKTVKSKHRFTILKIKELRVKSLEELDRAAR